MHDTTLSPSSTPSADITRHASTHVEPVEKLEKGDVVSTHVLVEQEKVDRLRELSRRTRIAQSEYLREAVDDLLTKYDKPEEL